MKKFIGKISIVLIFLLLASSISPTISQAKNLNTNIKNSNTVLEIYDKKLNDNIKISLLYANNEKSRVQAINSSGEVVYDYSFDINNNSMTSKLTGKTVEINMSKVDLPEETFVQSNNCSGPSYQNVSYTVREIAAGIAGAATLTAVTAKIIGLISVTTGFKVAGSGIKTAANVVLSAILSGNFNKSVYLRINFICKRMWHSDPFEPGGGFYFYGYKYDGTIYRGLW